MDGLGTAQGKKADALASFSTEAGETVELKGSLSLSPLGSEGTIAIAKVDLKKYAPYYSDAVRFDLRSGTLDARSGYSFAEGEGGTEFRLSGLGASVSDLRLRQREEKEEFLAIPEFSLKEAEVDSVKRQVTIGGIATAKGSVDVRRSAGGGMNVSRLVPDDGQTAAPAGAVDPRAKSRGKKPAEKPWSIVIKDTVVDRYSVRFEDRTTDPPVEIALDRLRLKAENIATAGKQRGKFSFATLYNRKGTVSLGGTFAVDPPSMNARLQAKNLPIGPVQPYFTEKVKILLTGGAISAEGNVSFDAPKEKPVRAGFRGELSVNDFSSLDKALGEEFLKFASLHFGGVEVGYNPTSVAIREIALADFYSRIIVNPNGTLNVQGIVAKEGAGQDNAALELDPGGGRTRGQRGAGARGPRPDRYGDAAGRRRELQRPVHQAELLREPRGDRRPRLRTLLRGKPAGGHRPAREAGEFGAPGDRRKDQPAGEGSLPRSQGGFPGHGPVAPVPLLRTVRGVRDPEREAHPEPQVPHREKESWTRRTRSSSTSSPSATRWTAPMRRSSPCGSRWRS